jgi:hypothetical protein
MLRQKKKKKEGDYRRVEESQSSCGKNTGAEDCCNAVYCKAVLREWSPRSPRAEWEEDLLHVDEVAEGG